MQSMMESLARTFAPADLAQIRKGLPVYFFSGDKDPVGGPDLAGSLTDLGLIDEYRIYLHPVVLGDGTPFFAAPRPPLRLAGSEHVDENVVLLTYVPA